MMKTLVKVFIPLLILASFLSAHAQISQESIQALWKGIGGKEKWETTNYILFTANGDKQAYLQSERTFLINRKSGQVRFEGKSNEGDNIAVFFNFKSGKLRKFYLNGTQMKEVNDSIVDNFGKIKEQLQKDASLLFLAALVDMPDTKTGTAYSKIVNAEKLQALPVELKDSALVGEVLFNEDTGHIKQIIAKDRSIYYVNGYKDIGGGLFLPTIFKNMNNSDKSIYFSIVAAFSDMEETKFNNL